MVTLLKNPTIKFYGKCYSKLTTCQQLVVTHSLFFTVGDMFLLSVDTFDRDAPTSLGFWLSEFGSFDGETATVGERGFDGVKVDVLW